MNTWTRRTLIGLGAVLLIGGWGITGYTSKWTSGLTSDALYAPDRQPEEPDEQRPMQASTRKDLWEQRGGAEIFAAGVVSMALGAGVIGVATLRADK